MGWDKTGPIVKRGDMTRPPPEPFLKLSYSGELASPSRRHLHTLISGTTLSAPRGASANALWLPPPGLAARARPPRRWRRSGAGSRREGREGTRVQPKKQAPPEEAER